MKQYIPIIGCLTGLILLATSPLQAQSDARNRSRLEMGRATSAPKSIVMRPLPARSLSSFSPSSNGLDRSLTNTSAVNAYFGSMLMSPYKATVTKPTAVETQVAQSTEPRSASVEEKSLRSQPSPENKMFANDRIVVSNIYPNPAVSDYAEIDYQFLTPSGEAKLVLLSIIGAPVAEYTLETHDRKLRVSTHSLTNGLYFYQLLLDGRTVATKKLLVRHQ